MKADPVTALFRRLVVLLSLVVLAWPLAVGAQQATTPTIAVLGTASLQSYTQLMEGFYQGLAETGYEAGKNIVVEQRWADGNYDRLRQMAAEFATSQAAVIFASANAAAIEARKATSKIPIVFVVGIDPVEYGLADSLGRPGGNTTGTVIFASFLVEKRLQILRDLVPSASVVAFLGNPKNPNFKTDVAVATKTLNSIGAKLEVVHASSPEQIDAAFARLVEQRVNAVFVSVDPFFADRREQIVGLAARNNLPAIYDRRDFAAAGGLISYGSRYADSYRQAGIYVGRILKGEKAANLPIQLPTRFELAINIKTAKALGIQLPSQLLLAADEVIE